MLASLLCCLLVDASEGADGCPAGTYADTKGSTLCKSCSPGTYADIKGSTYCKDCPTGTYTDKQGSSYCNLCPLCTRNGSSSCIDCLCQQMFPYVDSAILSPFAGTITMDSNHSNLTCTWTLFGKPAWSTLKIYVSSINLDVAVDSLQVQSCASAHDCNLIWQYTNRSNKELILIPTGNARVLVSLGPNSSESKGFQLSFRHDCMKKCNNNLGAQIAVGTIAAAIAIATYQAVYMSQDTEARREYNYQTPLFKLMVPILLVPWVILLIAQLFVTLWDYCAGYADTIQYLKKRLYYFPLRIIIREIVTAIACFQIFYQSATDADTIEFANISSRINYIQLWNVLIELFCIISCGSFFGEIRAMQAYNVLLDIVLIQTLLITKSPFDLKISGLMILSACLIFALGQCFAEITQGKPHVISASIAFCSSIVAVCMGQPSLPEEDNVGEILYRLGVFMNLLETSIAAWAAGDVSPIGACYELILKKRYRLASISFFTILFGVLPNLFDICFQSYSGEGTLMKYDRTRAGLFFGISTTSVGIVVLGWRECQLSWSDTEKQLQSEMGAFEGWKKIWIENSIDLCISLEFSGRSKVNVQLSRRMCRCVVQDAERGHHDTAWSSEMGNECDGVHRGQHPVYLAQDHPRHGTRLHARNVPTEEA